MLAKHVSGPKTAHIPPASRRVSGACATYHLALTEKSSSEKQGWSDERPCSSLVLCRSKLLLPLRQPSLLSRGR